MRDHAGATGRVAYVLKGYPRLSEVFITSEMYRLERLGVPLRLYVMRAADEEMQHDVVRRLRVEPDYLRQTTSLSATTLRRWLGENLGHFKTPLLRTARRHPAGLTRAATQAFAQAVRARRGFLAPPRKLYVKELLLAVDLADRIDDAGDVRHLHAHFAHGSTTVTWLAGTITGLPFSFTGHAKDIWTPELNPAGLLRRKMDAASFVVTCTDTNRQHLESYGSATPVHVVFHGLNADFEPLVAAAWPRVEPARVRLLAVARLVRKKGLDTFVDACAVLRDRDVDFEAVIVGAPGDHEEQVRARVAATGLGERMTLLGPMTQTRLFAQYQRASVFALPCRVLEDGDRDGIPNVLVEAMACGVPVVSTGLPGITELVRDGENGMLVAPDRPVDLADALHRLVKDHALARHLAERGRATVSERFDAATAAERMASLLTGIASGGTS
ncbi:glycosyltransferase family 4 protein [Nocardioides iriomotensis]|uniref:Colanic acid biosynthesis glycosyltransferase WcaL n=1 Tax=Nocardioides iriomotensis TaxID=715784 RepID=A0A4Q5IXF7_9ACTN|nr:glycosyltransferase family 4 protein [Nocardioides iriomotensis]RYU10643.1 colanic acid biosynthesis glycosyltransferase WcaL [Nocardioides iriomotensis]